MCLLKNFVKNKGLLKNRFRYFQKNCNRAAATITNTKKENAPLILISNNQNIHFNLSLENFLLYNYSDLLKYISTGSVETFIQPVLFLWRNYKSIIIGKNQNIWSECNLENIENDNVLVARRFSGGGAVYHDLGNLCFTFLNSNTNIMNNYEIILNGLKKHFNIEASTRGRNDLVIQNKKFSGSAYKKIKNVHLHHGTILINLERNVLNKYLTPDKMKYEKHGVSSVNARTINLVEINPTITHEKLCYALTDSFLDFYKIEKEQENNTKKENVINSGETNETNSSSYLIHFSELESKKLNIHYIEKNEKIIKHPEFLKYYNLLKDWDWCYGKTPKFQNKICNNFTFGKIEICFNVSDGVIKNGEVFSDSLDIQLIDQIKEIFNKNVKYSKESVSSFFKNLKVDDQRALNEVANWVLQEM